MWGWRFVQLKPVRFIWFAAMFRFSKKLRSEGVMDGVRFMGAWRLFDHIFKQELNCARGKCGGCCECD